MRASGILLPVSSLPGPYGIGCFSRHAYAFVDWLADAGQTFWQILPLGPTGFGDSPYQSFSTFAGNPYFIDLETLARDGLLTRAELDPSACGAAPEAVDYGQLYTGRPPLLRAAFRRWQAAGGADSRTFAAFTARSAHWLEDYALFTALKAVHGGAAWDQWPEPLRLRDPAALERARRELAGELQFQRFVQYEFDLQWQRLKGYANRKGVRIIGDLPIYVAFDSADTWAHPELFQLDAGRRPTGVAGVPPDGFSATGQLWGNPLYDWPVHEAGGYRWWIERMAHCYDWYDVVRIDHFRGFDEYYSIPYGEDTAVNGKWMPGPGMDLFRAIEAKLGRPAIIAEDLGFLTPSVLQLLKDSGFPGMKVLQFAFDARESSNYLPHTYPTNCVVYTGTHDNDTTRGWYHEVGKNARDFAKEYMCKERLDEDTLTKDFIAMAMSSVADLCVIPMQDYLNLGSEARINIPSTLGGNWLWRMKKGQFDKATVKEIARVTELYGR